MSRFKKFTESSNPMLKENAFKSAADKALLNGSGEVVSGPPMTVAGAINKTFILFGLMIITALISYAMPSNIFMFGGAIGGLIVVFVISAKPSRAPVWAPVYAILEGLFVGSVTAIFAGFMDGIIFQAVTLTFAVLFMMLFIYKSGIIKVTDKFRTGVMMATGAILIVYLVSFVLSFFGINLPFLHEGGMLGIGISLLIIGVAALNLLLDFDSFEKGERYGAPAYMEWFSAMGLLVTLVWLYVEILRLLAILNSND